MKWRNRATNFSDGTDSGSSSQDNQTTAQHGDDPFPEIRKVTSPRYESNSEFRGATRQRFDPYQDSLDFNETVRFDDSDEDFAETTAFSEFDDEYGRQYDSSQEHNQQETVRFSDTVRHEPATNDDVEPYEWTESGQIQTQERVIAQMHSHPFRLFFPALIAIAAAGAGAYFFGFFDEDWENWAVLTAGIIMVLLFGLLPFLFWLGTNYTITTRRVIIRRGFLTQIRQELLHSRNYDITVRRGPLQRMMGSGDVFINVGLDLPVVIKNIQDPILVQNVLQELMERSASSVSARRQRGAASGR